MRDALKIDPLTSFGGLRLGMLSVHDLGYCPKRRRAAASSQSKEALSRYLLGRYVGSQENKDAVAICGRTTLPAAKSSAHPVEY